MRNSNYFSYPAEFDKEIKLDKKYLSLDAAGLLDKTIGEFKIVVYQG